MRTQHALNNLLQKRRFTVGDLDRIAEQLAAQQEESGPLTRLLLNPHRSVWRIGNFDVNVVLAALREDGLHAVWFDRRQDVRRLRLEETVGLVLNVTTFFGRHWLALRLFEGTAYNLDSKLAKPQSFAAPEELLAFLRTALAQEDAQLLVVTQSEVLLPDLLADPPAGDRPA